MPVNTKKNQHYVPQLYLRQFAVDKDRSHIGIFFLDKQKLIAAGPIRSQAKEIFFYGEDGILEEALSKLEAVAAPALYDIINTNSLPSTASEAYNNIFHFIFTLAARTKDHMEQMKEFRDKFLHELDSYGDEEMSMRIKEYKQKAPNIAEFTLSNVSNSIKRTFDLKVKLLINTTVTPFITSDHPVIRYNQFLEMRRHPGGNAGLAAKGLQVFLPLSPKHMLLFYDDWVYKVGGRSQEVIYLENSRDIDDLNALQMLNCYDHIYFNDKISDQYVKELYNKTKSKRHNEYTHLRKLRTITDDSGQERTQYHSYNKNLAVQLQLSFVKQTKKAKQHVLSDYAVQLRDERWRSQ